MFEKKTVDAYQSIQAPEHLRRRVLGAEKAAVAQEKKPQTGRVLYRYAGLAAACLILVLAFALFVQRTPAQILLYADGQCIEPGQSVPAPQPNIQLRTADFYSLNPEPLSLVLTLASESKVSLSVSEGMLSCYNVETGEVLTNLEALEGKIQIYWKLNKPDPEQENRLYVKAQEDTVCYLLYYDMSENQWMICLEHEKE